MLAVRPMVMAESSVARLRRIVVFSYSDPHVVARQGSALTGAEAPLSVSTPGLRTVLDLKDIIFEARLV